MRTIHSQESNIAQLTQAKLTTTSIHYMWYVGHQLGMLQLLNWCCHIKQDRNVDLLVL